MTTVTELIDCGRQLGAMRVQPMGMSTRLAGAIVLRQAYEQCVDEYWQWVAPALQGASQRNQLVALRSYAGQDAAKTAAYLWHVLSDACHYDGYELPPTTHEIEHLASRLDELRAALVVAARRSPRRTSARRGGAPLTTNPSPDPSV